MFALIETNGATHIAINVPVNGAETSLPQLAKMLESNAVFINKSYSDVTRVTPAMTIKLGETLTLKSNYNDVELVVDGNCHYVLGEGFVIDSPEVHVNFQAALKKKDEENARIRKELDFIKSEHESLKAKMAELVTEDQD
jgi:hypothetical protein